MRSASSSRASKKILTFFAATLLLIPSLAGQSRMYKDADAVRKAVAKASRKAEKSRHASDWMKLAEVSEDACLFPLSNLVPGEGNSIRTLVVKGQRPREIMAETALPGIYRNIYTDKDIYFDADGNLVAIRVTRPVEDMDELMDRRREAYVRAYELDGKAIYTKSIAEGLSRLATEYRTLGQTADRLGEPERARELYLRSAAVSMTKPCAEPDTLAMRVYFQEQQRKEAEELERMRLEERKRQAYVIFSQGEQLYQEANYLYANQLYDEKKPYEALTYYRRILDYKDVERKLDRVCYRMLGRWVSRTGIEMEFREDGTCTIDGKAYYFRGSQFAFFLGNSPDALKEEWTIYDCDESVLSVENNKAKVQYSMTRVTE